MELIWLGMEERLTEANWVSLVTVQQTQSCKSSSFFFVQLDQCWLKWRWKVKTFEVKMWLSEGKERGEFDLPSSPEASGDRRRCVCLFEGKQRHSEVVLLHTPHPRGLTCKTINYLKKKEYILITFCGLFIFLPSPWAACCSASTR